MDTNTYKDIPELELGDNGNDLDLSKEIMEMARKQTTPKGISNVDAATLDSLLEALDVKPALVPAVINPVLDGEVIVPATAAELAEAADRIHKLVAGIGGSMFEIGEELVAIKAKLDHGEFGKWVKASLNIDERTAQRYMSVVEKFDGGKYDTVSVLPMTVIQKLAAPTVPDVLRDQVLAEIGAGNTPAPKDILFRIADAKDKQDKERAEADEVSRKTEGKTPEKAAKIRAKFEADRASQIAADTARRAKYEQQQKNSEQAASDAVALLQQHLGVEFPNFCKLHTRASYFFDQAIVRAASIKPENEELVSDEA